MAVRPLMYQKNHKQEKTLTLAQIGRQNRARHERIENEFNAIMEELKRVGVVKVAPRTSKQAINMVKDAVRGGKEFRWVYEGESLMFAKVR